MQHSTCRIAPLILLPSPLPSLPSLPSLLCVLKIIFLSTLFYLLNASKEQFLLVEMATKLIPRPLQLRQLSRDGQQQQPFVQVRLILHIVLSCHVMSVMLWLCHVASCQCYSCFMLGYDCHDTSYVSVMVVSCHITSCPVKGVSRHVR